MVQTVNFRNCLMGYSKPCHSARQSLNPLLRVGVLLDILHHCDMDSATDAQNDDGVLSIYKFIATVQ